MTARHTVAILLGALILAAVTWTLTPRTPPTFTTSTDISQALTESAESSGLPATEIASRVPVVDAWGRPSPVTATGADQQEISGLENVVRAALAPLQARLATTQDRLALPDLAAGEEALLIQERVALIETITRIAAVPLPQAGGDAVPGPPGLDPAAAAAAAFLAAAALLSAVLITRSARGRLSEAGPDRPLARALGVPVVPLGAPSRSPAIDLTGLWRTHLRDRTNVTTVQLTRPAACDLGAELVRAAALAGDCRSLDDRTPGSCRPPTDEPDAPAVRTLRTPTLDRDAARLLRDSGPTVLVVETASARRHTVVQDVAALGGIGADVVAVVVWQGRLPRDPARPWAPLEHHGGERSLRL